MAAGVAHTLHARVVARSENLRGQILMGGDNVSPLVKIRLTDLPKTGGGCLSPPSPPLATALPCVNLVIIVAISDLPTSHFVRFGDRHSFWMILDDYYYICK